ncbi:hypothetical protein D3227_39840 [Mesorhizobium waimense]|uniref:Uncharacterized protein n=1 Tax=Mesorhizobium waimense TaxID=1300307 RepID=A0A3A5JQA0_9HYPH|nr:hypothetical protein D3227_39840 [Mesorhizobium waimense]
MSGRRAARLPLGLLCEHPYQPGRQAEAAGFAGPFRGASPRNSSSVTSVRGAPLGAHYCGRVSARVSTRKVKAITGELCGHAFSASSISAISKRLDQRLKALPAPASRVVCPIHPDARYEKVRRAARS